MTFQLGVRLSLDKTGFSASVREAATEVATFGRTAGVAASDLRAIGTAADQTARSVTAGAVAQAKAVAEIAEASARARATVTRDAFGMEIGPSATAIAAASAANAAATDRLKAALIGVRAAFDPVTAATVRYEASLADLREAHRLGAISGELMVRQEAELKMAFERTVSAIARRDAAMKRAAETAVARQTIVPDRGADVAAYGAELDNLQAQFDPLFAASRRYRDELAQLERAHAVGAISIDAYRAREVELRMEMERTVSAITGRDAAMKRAAETAVARRTIVPDRGADVAAYGAELDNLQAQFDPLFAASRRYRDELAQLERAHAVGAISIDAYRAREVELRMEMERTVSAITGRNAAMKRAAETAVARQTIIPDRGGDVAAYGAELDRLRAKFNPIWAAGQQYRRTIEEIGQAERVGAITAGEATAARDRAKSSTATLVTALRAASQAHDGHAGSMKLSAFQAQNLSFQLHDVVVSLASGMNPLTVLLQQGSQITPIFGGIGGTLRAIGTVVNPATVGIAAVAIAAGVASKAAIDWSNALRAADVAARGVGRGAGTTAAEIDRIARSSADGGGVSVAAARDMATEFTRTGRIGSEQFSGLIAITKDFGATIGQDVPTATSILAKALADPARGAQDLAESYNLLDSAQVRAIKRMADQGRTTDAQRALTDALRARIIPAGETVAWYARMWDDLKQSMSNFYDSLGRQSAQSIDPVRSLEAQLEGAKRQAAIARAAQAPSYGIWDNLGAPAGATAADREVERLQAELDAAKKKAAEQKAAADAKAVADVADRQGKAALEIAGASGSSIVRDQLARQKLVDETAQLKAGQAARNLTAEEDKRLAAAIEAKTRALSTWISESERARQLAQIDLDIAATRDPVERAELERKRALVTIAGQEVGAAEATAAANLAYARSIGDVSAAARGNVTDLMADAAAHERVNALVLAGAVPLADMNRELQIEAATRQLVALAARSEGAEKERILELIAQTRAAITAQTEAQKKANALQEIRTGDDRLQTLRTQIALVGQSEAAQARVIALLEAEQKIRAQGYTGADADRIRSQAVEGAALTTVLERQKAAWEEIKSTGGDAIDTLVEGMRTGQDVGKQLADSLTKEFLKLAISNPLKNAVFGQNLPTLDNVGGLLGGLFGGDQKAAGIAIPNTVGTAQITAATVIVNGAGIGAGGLASLTGGSFSDSILNRSSFSGELANPVVRNKLFAMTEAEVGGQGSQAQQAFMESLFNRASARGMSLDQVLGDRRYFPAETFARADGLMGSARLDGKYAGLLDQVRGGSNVSNWATGNASGTVGFGGGPQTAFFGGEKFGIEKPDMSWVAQQKQAALALQSSSTQASSAIGNLGSSSSSAVDAVSKFGQGTNQAANALTNSSGGIAQASTTMNTTITSTSTTTQSAFGQLTSGLSSAFSSLFSGLGNVLGGIGGGIGSLFGGIGSLFGFADGGFTGNRGRSTIAGFVHGDEFVVNSWATARHRPLLEAINDNRMPGYADGGYVGGMPMMGGATPSGQGAAPTPMQPVIQQSIINNTQAQISTREESDGKGGRRQVIVIDEMVGQAVGRARSKTQKAMQTAFGLKNQVTRR